MTYFAQIKNGIVTNVIVADQSFIDTLTDPQDWLETSYTTYGNVNSDGGAPFRGNYAGIGFTYDAVNDVFIPPKPYPSWLLDTATWLWNAPIPMPDNGLVYYWDEATLSWVLYQNQLNQMPVIIGEKNLQGGGNIKFYPPSVPTPNITQWMWKEKGASTYTIFTNVDNSVTITIPTQEDILIGCINHGVEMWSSNDVLVTPL